jgi:hypothetical protein
LKLNIKGLIIIYFETKFDGLSCILIPLWRIWCMTYKYWISWGWPLDFEVQNEEEKIPQCRNGSQIRIEKYYRKGKIDTLLHKHMTTQYQNTIPLRRKHFSSSMVLYGNHLCESIVNKPLSFLFHFFLRSSSDHSCHTYSRKRKTHFSIMSVNM